MTELPRPGANELAEIFDLDRKDLYARMVSQIEQCLRDIDSAREDLKQIMASCKEAQISRSEIAAMRKIAQLRLNDQIGRAREELAALQRVGNACGLALFEWAESSDDQGS